MPPVKVPHDLTLTLDAHNKWLQILKDAQELVRDDIDMQDKCATGFRLKERKIPAEFLGRTYAQYCVLINKMYDSFLNNVQLQRAPYMVEIISVFLKRLYELRNELVHYIVNDYIYVDQSLVQMKLTPDDIQIVVPYHYPLECRTESSELLLQKMWLDAVKRKTAPLKKKKTKAEKSEFGAESKDNSEQSSTDEDDESEAASQHTVRPADFIQANIIQRHERFRQFFMVNFKAKCIERKTFFSAKTEEAPLDLKITAARFIQKTYREFMKIKRQRFIDLKRDMMTGLIPNPWSGARKFEEENNKMYERQSQIRSKLHNIFLKELEKEKIRLIVFKKEDQIDDITDETRQWFKDWYHGYGFFPEFPYEVEGGTMMVVRGEFPSIEEQIEADEKYLAKTKGKTKDQIKQEAEKAKADAAMKAEVEKDKRKKEAQQLLKMRCDPFGDPGYEVKTSQARQGLMEALQKYRSAWSIHDRFAPGEEVEVVYGFMQAYLTEELMREIHRDCRKYVDELMRLDLKLLIKMHQVMYKRVGWKYPKLKTRKKPPTPSKPKPLLVNEDLLKTFEPLFDMGIISKPTTKLNDVYGDSNFAAYDYNVRDPDAFFSPPGYGDVKRRIMYSCVYGIGVDKGATRLKSVMLLGPPRNGKSFLVDAAAGELNAVKIDITPELFSAKLVDKPAKMLGKVLQAARAFQPTIIFVKNVEKVFAKKILPEDRYLNATQMKAPLAKMVKAISNEDKIIFIATCSDPNSANRNPLVSLFNETILVPRTDYGSIQQFFYNKLSSIRSMPRNICVQALAQLLQGYGFGVIVQVYNRVMNNERILRLNVTHLSVEEFLEAIMEENIQPVTVQDYQAYVDFFIANHSSLQREREEYSVINEYREVIYKKAAEKRKKRMANL